MLLQNCLHKLPKLPLEGDDIRLVRIESLAVASFPPLGWEGKSHERLRTGEVLDTLRQFRIWLEKPNLQ